VAGRILPQAQASGRKQRVEKLRRASDRLAVGSHRPLDGKRPRRRQPDYRRGRDARQLATRHLYRELAHDRDRIGRAEADSGRGQVSH
jgi:hypothetical protein